MRYYMYRDERDGLWSWVLLGEHGRTLARSMQSFSAAEQCREAIDAVMRAGPDTPVDDGAAGRTAPEASEPSEETEGGSGESGAGGFEDVGLKRPDTESSIPAQEPNQLPQIGR